MNYYIRIGEMKKIFLATSNPGKIGEVKKMLPDNYEIITPDWFNLSMPDEDGVSFDQNAKIKSKVMFAKSGIPTIAEDSGLVVDALDGRPGIYSARYAETPELANQKILDEMKDVDDRSARFVCTVAFTWSGGDKIFRGTIEGQIAHEPKGENGFGYDPIFLFDGVHTTAEISREEKNKISHRGQALRKFAKWFKENEKMIFGS
ncbi:MAG: RdgB/HAM1 family non-canonical purine NTP pyrophosphatase [Caldisericia bacterium]